MAIFHVRGPDAANGPDCGLVGPLSPEAELTASYAPFNGDAGILLADTTTQLTALLVAWPAQPAPPVVGSPSISLTQISIEYQREPPGPVPFLVAKDIEQVLWLVDRWHEKVG